MGFGNEGRITQLSAQGETDFAIGFTGFRPYEVAMTTDGHIYAADTQTLVRTDDQGNVEWAKNTQDESITDIACSEDGKAFLLTYRNSELDITDHLYSIDGQSGNEVWSLNLGPSEGEPSVTWYAIRSNNIDGGVLLIGKHFNEGLNIYEAAIASIDSSGNLRWLTFFHDGDLAIQDIWLRTPEACILDLSGDIIVFTDYDDVAISSITRLDSALGNVIWTKGYRTFGELTKVGYLAALDNDTFGGCLSMAEELGTDSFIESSCFIRFDDAGAILSAYGFATSGTSEFGFAHPQKITNGYSLLGFNNYEDWSELSSTDINQFAFNSSGVPTFSTCATSKNYASLISAEPRDVNQSVHQWTPTTKSWDITATAMSTVPGTMPQPDSICSAITF